jgi:hypothetical protein
MNKFEVIVTTDGHSTSVLILSSHLEPMYKFLYHRTCLHVMGRPSWREDGAVITVTPRFKSRKTHDHILLSHLRLRTSLFVASCDSQGDDGGILTRLHTA